MNWIQSNNLWSTDPMFVSPDSGDFHLQACSPAINAGLNDGNLSTKDLLGQPRVQFGTVDIGAIEAGPLQQYAPAETTPACNSESANGSIRFSTVDLCAPATYNWSTGASGIELNKQSGLMPGNYQVTITDSKGRIGVFALEVPLGLAMHLKVASDPLVCGDTTGGRLSVQVEGSNSGPYQYNWGFSSDSVVSGLPAGLYQVTVIDAQGCTSSATASVQKTGALDLALDLVPISCNGTADGSLTILPANGKAPFSWLWSDGANTPTRGALGPGIYQGVLTDAFDCKIQWYLPLTEPDVLQINAQVNAASGPQIADGSLLLDNVSGGTKPYSPVWSNGQSGLQISGLLPGTYTCTLTDANGCSVIRTFEVPFVSATRDWIQESGFKIYPNPNQGVFTLEGRGLGQMQFELLDETGRTVLSYNLEAPVGSKFYYAMQTNLPSGPYHWHVMDANGRVAQGNMTVFH
ncbi:MAG: hypothetical protein KGS48_08940 [Bacteroidetes bacterium]|nr:hypothetical protein [Bacteroidota bacterium]